jgi:hypothetical protein
LAWATPERAIAAASIAARVVNNRMRLISATFHEGRGDQPHLKLINEASLLLVSADVCAIE